MKVDRRNPAHWAALAVLLVLVLLALVLRPLRRTRRGRRRVVLYGHRLAGNLLAIHAQLRQAHPDMDAAFLTMDRAYHRQLLARGEPSVLATSWHCVEWLSTADALVSDHGLHAMVPLLFLSDLKFFDTWHGIPFKGFDGDDFRVQHRYDEAWVASPMLAQLYVERFGFAPERVVPTGYPRTDLLVRERDSDPAGFRRALSLPEGKLVLFAPTWGQDAAGRSLVPFGVAPEDFFGRLSVLAREAGATIAVRTHLNSGVDACAGASRHPGVVVVPYAIQPDTERLLLASDVLVCDWSSIAFDFLLLDRPAIFLDVAPPFAKGLSLGREYRYGALAGDLDGLLARLDACLRDPGAYATENLARHRAARAEVYGGCADGHATARCIARLEAALERR